MLLCGWSHQAQPGPRGQAQAPQEQRPLLSRTEQPWGPGGPCPGITPDTSSPRSLPRPSGVCPVHLHSARRPAHRPLCGSRPRLGVRGRWPMPHVDQPQTPEPAHDEPGGQALSPPPLCSAARATGRGPLGGRRSPATLLPPDPGPPSVRAPALTTGILSCMGLPAVLQGGPLLSLLGAAGRSPSLSGSRWCCWPCSCGSRRQPGWHRRPWESPHVLDMPSRPPVPAREGSDCHLSPAPETVCSKLIVSAPLRL